MCAKKKPVWHYSELVNCEIGKGAILCITDRPHLRSYEPATTSVVISYDAKTGLIETQGSFYLPDK